MKSKLKHLLYDFLHWVGLSDVSYSVHKRKSASKAKKMYILVKDDLPKGFSYVGTSHAPLAVYLDYKNDPDMKDWLANSFRKVVCKVTEDQFEKALVEAERFTVITESNLGDRRIAAAFCPRDRDEWPEWFRQLPLYT